MVALLAAGNATLTKAPASAPMIASARIVPRFRRSAAASAAPLTTCRSGRRREEVGVGHDADPVFGFSRLACPSQRDRAVASVAPAAGSATVPADAVVGLRVRDDDAGERRVRVERGVGDGLDLFRCRRARRHREDHRCAVHVLEARAGAIGDDHSDDEVDGRYVVAGLGGHLLDERQVLARRDTGEGRHVAHLTERADRRATCGRATSTVRKPAPAANDASCGAIASAASSAARLSTVTLAGSAPSAASDAPQELAQPPLLVRARLVFIEQREPLARLAHAPSAQATRGPARRRPPRCRRGAASARLRLSRAMTIVMPSRRPASAPPKRFRPAVFTRLFVAALAGLITLIASVRRAGRLGVRNLIAVGLKLLACPPAPGSAIA